VPTPFVSVLIDTYNHERFIEQAIVSVLEQDFPASDREIIVVDDGSTDRTPEMVRKFEPRVRVLRKINGGQASAFNAGIPECKGEIVSFLDGDDWWAKKKIARVTDALLADDCCGIVGHGIANAFECGAEIVDVLDRPERLRVDSVAAARVFRLRKNYLGTSRMTMRSRIARQLLPIPASLIIEADEYLFTLGSTISDVVILAEVLTHYRQHEGNLYNAAGGNKQGLLRKQRVMAALAKALRTDLTPRGTTADVIGCLCEIVEAEAKQMKLMLEGGMSWQTVRTENTIFRIMHAGAPPSHRLFRAATMIPALLLPPRWFYAGRYWLGKQRWYLRVRQHTLAPSRNTVGGY
jgi:hypothetical protein